MSLHRLVPADVRPWTEVDPFAPRPDDTALATSRERVYFTSAGVDGPATRRLTDAFRSSSGRGDALVATFDVGGVDDVAHWYLSRNRFAEYGFVEVLLRSPAFAAQLPVLVPDGDTVRRRRFQAVDSFFEVSPHGLTSGVAWRLGSGPSRSGPQRGPDTPGSLASAFVTQVVGGRVADHRVDRCATGWSSWFHHACWDDSWLITDRRHRRLTLLCCTDAE